MALANHGAPQDPGTFSQHSEEKGSKQDLLLHSHIGGCVYYPWSTRGRGMLDSIRSRPLGDRELRRLMYMYELNGIGWNSNKNGSYGYMV